MYKKLIGGIIVLIALFIAASIAFAATINPTTREVTTESLFVDWSDTNPEEILDIRWKSSPNLTNAWQHPFCPSGDLEYFGNSWVSQDEGTSDFVFVSLVGWGTTGTWDNPNNKNIKIVSSSDGCPASAGVPIETKYHIFDRGPAANKVKVQRRFYFGESAFPYNFRPYIPRLYPRDAFTEVLHPDATGTSLMSETAESCEFGCMVTDWDGTWFAIHDPIGGRGLIVRRGPSPYEVALWVDQDAASFTNSSSMLLLQPTGGFTGTIVENEFLCFYDESTWTPSLALPPGC